MSARLAIFDSVLHDVGNHLQPSHVCQANHADPAGEHMGSPLPHAMDAPRFAMRWVGPNAIRAERSEQEVDSSNYLPEQHHQPAEKYNQTRRTLINFMQFL